MSPHTLRSLLEGVARRVGVEVRFEAFEGSSATGRRGGLCKVRGVPVILVDSRAPLRDQIATLEGALRRLDLEGIFLPPVVRARLEPSADPAGPTLKKARTREGSE